MANFGGGASSCTLNNCTVTGNAAYVDVGGASGCTLKNCIVYFNTGGSTLDANFSGCVLNFCCATPFATNGIGNLTNDPAFVNPSVSDYHLQLNSPCINKGNNAYVTTATDLDGNPRIVQGTVDVGAYEFQAPVPLVASLQSDGPNALLGFPLAFLGSCLGGTAISNYWDFGDGTVVSNAFSVAHAWSVAGKYVVTFWVFAAGNVSASATTTVQVTSQAIYYVDAGSTNPVAPFASWSTAATNLQNAVDAAAPGALVLVNDGIYGTGNRSVDGTTSNRLEVTYPLTIQSVNGPASTAIDGGGAVRGVYLADGAALIGFTVTNGFTSANGGGVFCETTSAMVSNCVLIANGAGNNGGGAFQGSLQHCVLTGNYSYNGCGADSSLLNACTVSGNTTSASFLPYGGGLNNCQATACLIANNSVGSGRGAGANASTLDQCIVSNNSCSWFGGGIAYCTANNCLLVGNSTWQYGGCASYSTLNNCTITGNACSSGAPVTDDSTLDNCILYFNIPANYSDCVLNFSCTTPLPTNGVGNITNAPQFAGPVGGDSSLQSNSPCINAGNNAYVTATNDLAGNPRIFQGTVDMGAYEFETPVPLLAFIQTSYVNVEPGFPLSFAASGLGAIFVSATWDFGDGTVVTNSFTATHAWEAAGVYPVTLWLYTASQLSVSATTTMQVSSQTTYYVDAGSTNPMAPFRTWSTAATNIQNAVDVAAAGATVMVADGNYQSSGTSNDGVTTNCVTVTKPLTLQSANGPWMTEISGGGRMRCVDLADGAQLSGFTLGAGATLGNGGGVYCESSNAIVLNCIFTTNQAAGSGGGGFGGTLFNCAFFSNQAGNSGGATEGAALDNCTLTGNTANGQGGGADACALNNCLVWANGSPNGTNYSNSLLNYCDTAPLPTNGANNLATDPQMADNVHVAVNSPCRGAGNPAFAEGADIDAEPWLDPPSIGCDEYYPGATGPLHVSCTVDFPDGMVDYPANFTGLIIGHATLNTWNFGDGTLVSNRLAVTHAWTNTGVYSVTLTAYNDDFSNGVSATVQITIGTNLVYFVDPGNASPVAPYRSWASAANDIPTAVGASFSRGDLILVTNGVFSSYNFPSALTISKPVRVRSVNGPMATTIFGEPTGYYGPNRCVYLVDGAGLDGFALVNGYADRGGGAYCETTNCFLTNCNIGDSVWPCSASEGGGVFGGTVVNSLIHWCGNTNTYGGGANHCLLINCKIENNYGFSGAGAFGSTLAGCSIDNNTCGGFDALFPSGPGGGLEGCVATYCLVTANWGGPDGGGADSCTLSNCLVSGNQANVAGGVINCLLGNCVVAGNYGYADSGGATASSLWNCILTRNATTLGNGGAVSCTLINSLISSNYSQYDGVSAAYGCIMTNCTIVENASDSEVAVEASQLYNCINYFNQPGNDQGSTYNYSCTTPLPANGVGNTSLDPGLQPDDLHLTAASACRGAGNPAYATGLDLDGQPWLDPPSIGCVEFSTNPAPFVAIQANFTNVLLGYPLTFQGTIAGGQAGLTSWSFGDETVGATALTASHTWLTAGDYVVTLTAFFKHSPLVATASLTIHVLTNNAPSLPVQPASETVVAGGTAQFNVVASGSPMLNYQWQFNGMNIVGATNASLTFFNAQTNEAGNYSVTVVDPLCYPTGVTVSSNAILSVILPVCAPPPSGMVAWWRAEGDFADVVDGNNGLGQNVSFANGKVGRGFIFNDGSSSITVPASPTLNIGSNSGLSIEGWIQPDAFAVGGSGAPIVEWDAGTTNFVQFWAGGTLFANLVDNSGVSHTLQSGPGILDTNHWQHVAFTYDIGSGNATIYVNGNVVAAGNFGSVIPQTGCAVNLGWSASSTNFFGGLMDELSIYNRALLPSEITAIFNAEYAGKCNVPVAPTVVQQPNSLSVLPGAGYAFNVVAAGTPPLYYQWRLNGNPIRAATNSSLLLSNALCSQAGNLYAVAITNAGGSVISSNAVLAIINTPPQISNLSNQLVDYAAPVLTLPLLVVDPGLPASTVGLSGTSSNTNLIPNAQIVFAGTDSNGMVTLTANSNSVGVATITVIATGPCGATDQTSFDLLVTNYPPQISSLGSQKVPLNATLGPLAFTVADVETPASQLTVTANSSNHNFVPTNQIVLGGVGTNRTVTILPGTNSPGTATVTLTVTDSLGATAATSFSVTVSQFTPIALGLPPLDGSVLAWGDYDNDGQLDLLVSGTTNGQPSGALTRIYHNDGGVFTNFISLTNLYQGAVAWADYDRDGRLDAIVSGLNSSNVPVTQLYHNNGDGTFSPVNAGFAGAYSGTLAWGDFDNDGAADLFLSGLVPLGVSLAVNQTNIAKLYRNNGDGTFTDINLNLPGPYSGTAAWGDFDNDGRQDLLLVGELTSRTGVAGIFRNLGNGVFTNVFNSSLNFENGCSGAWGDYDNDGWLDLGISGYANAAIYHNNGNGTFTAKALPATGPAPSLAWGDYNNDGYLDLVVGSASGTVLYRNNGTGTFTSSGIALPPLASPSWLAWGDFNHDEKLDLILTAGNTTTIYANANVTTNTPPAAPTNLAATAALTNTVFFAWTAPLKMPTGSNGLNYNLRVGTTPGGVDVVSPLADPTNGLRRVAALGNVGPANHALLINLPQGTYYWSVQAIDTAFAGSPFAPDATFTISNARPTISRIANQVVAPLTPTPPIGFSIGDAETSTSNLVLAARCSNPSVVALTNIIFGGQGSNRTVQITPSATGVATIAITATDAQGAFASAYFIVNATAFSLVSSNLIPVQNSFVAWGDYNNDGRLDVLMAGNTNGNSQLPPVTQLYRNDGHGGLTPVVSGLPGITFGSAAWGDYNNDGYLDLILTGTTNGQAGGAIARIYRNNGDGTFTDAGARLPGIYYSAVAWGDFDNDGRLDLLLTGTTNGSASGAIARIYHNNGDGTFSNTISLLGIYEGSVACADFAGNGDLDIVLAGMSQSGSPISWVYRNNGDGMFTQAAALTGVFQSSVAVGDFDNDGRPDILLAGFNGSYLTSVYHNNGNFSFSNIGTNLPGTAYGSVAWGDFDHDGRLDILLSGTSNGSASGAFTRIYHNTGSAILSQSFSDYSATLPTNYLGAATWADCENNGKLDVLLAGTDGYARSQTMLFHNNVGLSNAPPVPPTALTAARSNNVTLLSWAQSTEAQTTNLTGLKYQIRVGATPGGIEIESPGSELATGYRRIVQTGDASTNRWRLANLPPGNYFWSVQAIDTAFAGSAFSAESTFTVLPSPLANPDTVSTASNTPASFAASRLTLNDVDPNGLPLSVIAVSQRSEMNGTVLLAAGMVTYTPPYNFNGNDTFTYTISDGQSAPATGTVLATVGSGGLLALKLVSGPAIENGNFVVWLAGLPGLTYTVEAASRLEGPWAQVGNITAPTTNQGFGLGALELLEPVNGNTRQFYRLVYPPH